MKTTVSLITISATLLTILCGCAKTWQAAPFPDQSINIENPKMSRIYLICDTVLGTAVHDPVIDGDMYIGTIGPGSYFCWEREPENTTITVNPDSKWTNTSNLELSLIKGKTYYIQLHRWPAPLAPIYKLELTNQEKGRQLLKKCKPAGNIR